jgi:phosphomannomutase/phosphoglucomutase
MNPHVFKTYDLRGAAEVDFPDGEVERLGRALGAYFLQRDHRRVIVGRDNRRHSLRLRNAVTRGLVSTGCEVLDIGEVITPVFYFAHHLYGYKAGVMITASHNPPEDNGFKIFCGESTIYGEDIQRLKLILEQGDFPQGQGQVVYARPEEDYIKYITGRIHLERSLKVAVDAGNGTAGPVAVKLLEALGCEVIPLYCDPDPSFPNHHPDPTVVENLRDLIRLVREAGADVGLSFDGDGDRLGVVDEKGRVIWGDILQVLFWREILPRFPGAPAIVEVKCSQALVDEIVRLGGKPFFYKTGHSLIKAKMREVGAPFTGEMSGHFFFADEYFGFDDAPYAAARLLRILARSGKPLSDLLADISRLYSTPETRIPCPEERKEEVVHEIISSFRREGYDVIDVDGARIQFPSGWGLVRASNTQPVLVARCEASSLADLQEIAGKLKNSLICAGVKEFQWDFPVAG